MRSASGRRKASSTRVRARSSGPRSETPRRALYEGTTRACSTTAAGGMASGAAQDAPAPAARARRRMSLGRRARLGSLDLGRVIQAGLGLADLPLDGGVVEVFSLVLGLERLAPVLDRLAHRAAASQHVAQMIEHDGVGPGLVDGAPEELLGLVDAIEAVHR